MPRKNKAESQKGSARYAPGYRASLAFMVAVVGIVALFAVNQHKFQQSPVASSPSSPNIGGFAAMQGPRPAEASCEELFSKYEDASLLAEKYASLFESSNKREFLESSVEKSREAAKLRSLMRKAGCGVPCSTKKEVCGENGITYRSECAARESGVPVLHFGKCNVCGDGFCDPAEQGICLDDC